VSDEERSGRRDPEATGAPARRAWLPGLVVGCAAGFATLEIPSLGWLLVLAFAIPALAGPARWPAIAGLLTGVGAIWLILLGRVALTCRAVDGEVGCQAPGIEPWLWAGAGILAAGLLLTALWRRRSR
jgi:hypothetical protein